ncbi:methionine--tRNA ligase [Candidatus Gracilibacteria bacterium]|nr:methionine--tRNA ligase [Candidatus Gracilibacteria bacterium]MCF7898852.1 methionine--tRNA ligase [Candidatus Paceibacterota bacterium]
MITKKPFYITTTLPYVNAEPHIGHALEFVRADVIARYKESLGYDVFFNTGTDEHGTKILEGAEKEGISVQEYVDRNAARFKELYPKLGITKDIHFIRTTDEKHIKAAQEIWKRCDQNGYIDKKEYEAKYCVGCELHKTDSELIDGKCPIHPNREIEIIKEENYFFAFKKIKPKLKELYENNPSLVIPDFRFNEIKAFLDRGLEDFSISRLKSNMSWGIPVPGDDEHVMYVWFDALTNYISTLDWPEGENYKKYWEQVGQEKREVVQYCGKDNLRQQSAIWQAMLLAAELPTTTNIIINGFVTAPDGTKMSKSLGNVVSPTEVIEAFKDVTDYPEDVIRFVLLHDISSFEDGGMSLESIKQSYQAHLQNGIGNLTNRIMKLAVTYDVRLLEGETFVESINTPNYLHVSPALDIFYVKEAIDGLMACIKTIDNNIQQQEPFKVIKIDEIKGKVLIHKNLHDLWIIAQMLSVFMPSTSTKIIECIRENKMPEKPLFNRLP